jgi:hypothetical protein
MTGISFAHFQNIVTFMVTKVQIRHKDQLNRPVCPQGITVHQGKKHAAFTNIGD